jgi:mRNA-degrading endonuclease RelE of RelBE toxin-antitoxin system
MNFEIISLPIFDKQVKRLSKKYPSIRKDLVVFTNELLQNPKQGSSLGKNLYKVRMAIASKGKGKSGGARVVTYVKVVNNKIYLAFIYDKNELDSLNQKQLDEIIGLLP